MVSRSLSPSNRLPWPLARSLAAAWALVDKHSAGATDTQRQLLFDSLHAALTRAEARKLVDAVEMTGATVEMTSDRHYTIECR